MVALFDIWDHYWFRTQIDFNMKSDVFQGFLDPTDAWMDKYTVPNAATLKELVYLTQDVEEEDGPVPDFLQEDADPDAIQKWIDGTYVNPHQVQPLAQTDWALSDEEVAAADQSASDPKPAGNPDGNPGQKPGGTTDAPAGKPEGTSDHKPGGTTGGLKPHEAVVGTDGESGGQPTDQPAASDGGKTTKTCDKPMHPVMRLLCKAAAYLPWRKK
jgi:hypothetical protein